MTGVRLSFPGPRLWAAPLLLCCAWFVSPASAEIYGWTDASGVTTYSNLPPPQGAKLTDVIHETPLSPQALAEAAHNAEVSALNDRIRLLELEMARQQRQVVDYAGAPAPAAGIGCGPGGYVDCDPAYDYTPYFTTGLLYGDGMRGRHLGHGRGNGNGRGGYGGGKPAAVPAAPMRISHAGGVHGTTSTH